MADISGYSTYLNESELEHARDTLSALLEVLIEGTRPPLVVSKLEGDAVFSYSEDRNLLVGQTLIEMVESTYLGFRRAIDLMVLNNTCGCNACTNVSTLDLKFFVHHGAFATQTVGRHSELVGSHVNLTHRLLKNSITNTTGIRAYTAYTDAAIARLGQDLTHQMRRVEESYDVGDVVLWVQDMHPVWEARREESVVVLAEEDMAVSVEVEFDLPVEVVWDYLADLEFRKILIGSDRQEVVGREGGRVMPGTTYQCYHGNRIVNQVVLEWKPFEKIVTRDRVGGVMGNMFVLSVFEFRREGEKTVLTQKAGGITGHAVGRAFGPFMLRMIRSQFQRDADAFREAVVADHQQRSVA